MLSLSRQESQPQAREVSVGGGCSGSNSPTPADLRLLRGGEVPAQGQLGKDVAAAPGGTGYHLLDAWRSLFVSMVFTVYR